jgi:excisionase family DNA binding protein
VRWKEAVCAAALQVRTMDQQWLSIKETASLCQVAPNTVRRWIQRGFLAAYRVGGPRSPYRIKPEDVRALDHPVEPGDFGPEQLRTWPGGAGGAPPALFSEEDEADG